MTDDPKAPLTKRQLKKQMLEDLKNLPAREDDVLDIDGPEAPDEDAAPVKPMPPIRLAVRSLYDAQELRINMKNRLARHAAAGVLAPGWAEKLGRHALMMEVVELSILADLKGELLAQDIAPWLLAHRGIGPALASVLISEVGDPARFENVSKLWAYAGLHVQDGHAVKRQKGQRANWNPFFKSKALGVLAKSFIMLGNEQYGKLYGDYKVRIANRPCWKPAADHVAKKEEGGRGETPTPNGCTKGHMEARAKRYMVKQFLADYLTAWRTMRGLPVRPPYAEEYLGKVHHG